MFEPLPFFNGRHLNYSQFFFYLISLLILIIFVVFGGIDLALNITVWSIRRKNSRRIFKRRSSDEMEAGFTSSLNRDNEESQDQDDLPINQSRKSSKTKYQSHKREVEREEMKKEVELQKRPNSSELSQNPKRDSFSANSHEDPDENSPLNVVHDSQDQDEGIDFLKRDPSEVRILYYFIISFEIILAILVLFFWDVMNSFGVIYPGVLSLFIKSFIVLAFIPLITLRFYFLYQAPKKYLNPNVSWKIKGPLLGLVVAGVFLYNWGVMYFWRGICIANHNNDIRGFHFSNFGITTATTRGWYHNTCPDKDRPCFVYITLPEDALGSIFINYHINLNA